MRVPWVVITLWFLTLSSAGPAAAQSSDSRAGAQQPADDSKVQQLLQRYEPDEGGGIHFTKHLAVVFGDIKPGSGVAIGPAISTKFADGGYAQLKAVYSIRDFKLLQAFYETRKFANVLQFSARARWQDAPRLNLFPLGPNAPLERGQYGERKTEASTQATLRLVHALRFGAGTGIERYALTGGRIVAPDDESLSAVPTMPGLTERPWYAHSFVLAGIDTRPSPDYARRGTVVEAIAHDYHDWHNGHFSFQRLEGEARQLLPMFGGRGVAEVMGHVWMSQATGTREVPFFLMPTLGGGEYLEGYRLYRYRDRDAMLLRGEYRWAVHDMVDLAVLYEAGKTVATARALGLNDLRRSVGAGIRVHSSTSTLLRFDVAHSHEGYQLAVGVSAGGR
jgi:hypothetical protein